MNAAKTSLHTFLNAALVDKWFADSEECNVKLSFPKISALGDPVQLTGHQNPLTTAKLAKYLYEPRVCTSRFWSDCNEHQVCRKITVFVYFKKHSVQRE